MKTSKHKTTSLEYWLEWIKAYKVWWGVQPDHIYMPSSQDVLDVPYEALDALAVHFEDKVRGEDTEHRKWVTVEVWRGMSCVVVCFRSSKRKFAYKPLKNENPLC